MGGALPWRSFSDFLALRWLEQWRRELLVEQGPNVLARERGRELNAEPSRCRNEQGSDFEEFFPEGSRRRLGEPGLGEHRGDQPHDQ